MRRGPGSLPAYLAALTMALAAPAANAQSGDADTPKDAPPSDAEDAGDAGDGESVAEPNQEDATEDPDASQARALYLAGTEAAEAGRWDDALKRFTASYALDPNPAALFNVAVALRGLGRHRQSRDAFDRLLADHPDVSPSIRTRALELRAEVAARLASVTIATYADCEIRIDGALDPSNGTMRKVELDAGAHTLTATCPKRAVATKDIALAEGEEAKVTLTPAMLKPTIVTREAPPRSPFPWVLIGIGGATAAAGGILWGVSVSERATVEDAPDGTPWADVAGANDRAILFSWLGPTLLGTGVALAAGGLTWRLLEDDGRDAEQPRKEAAALTLRVAGAGLFALEGTW